MMVVEMTDAQVARLFELCEAVVKTAREVPAPPPGMNGDLERAKHIRGSLEKRNDLLLELGALLR